MSVRYYVSTVCGSSKKYLVFTNLVETETPSQVEFVDNGNYTQIQFNANSILALGDRSPDNNPSNGMFLTTSTLPNIFWSVVKIGDGNVRLEGMDNNNTRWYVSFLQMGNMCRLIATKTPPKDKSLMTLTLEPVQLPTMSPSHSATSSSSSNLPIILGVSIPLGIILLAGISFLLYKIIIFCRKLSTLGLAMVTKIGRAHV